MLDAAEELLQQRRIPESIVAFRAAEAAGYDADRCAAGCWIAAMLSGEFEAAWQESDGIRRRGAADPNRFWQGEDLTGKRVIVRCLHGFGDTVQFLRYIPLLRSLASHVIVECAPDIVELAHCMRGIDEVVTWGLHAPRHRLVWDVQMELMELPYFFRSTLASLPSSDGYLKLPGGTLAKAKSAVERCSLPRVGIVWASGDWNPSRSVKFEAIRSILDRDDFEFWNLQGGPHREQWLTMEPRANVRDHPMLNNAGIVPLAAFIAQLDLVISVDTLAAHLAGTLKVPCFLMLQHAADWRWMTGREDSPWYPSLRLFRQPRSGDWETVVRQVDSALEGWSQATTRCVA
jgi:hypothetical protein